MHRAFTVITKQGEGEKAFWLEIGASFEHEDGQGFTIALQALPLDGRAVLREVGSGPREKEDRRPDDREQRDDDRATRRSTYRSGSRSRQ